MHKSLEIVKRGKTRALLRFHKDDWPWHIYKIRIADFSEAEWNEIEKNGLDLQYTFVFEQRGKKRTGLGRVSCAEYLVRVIERKLLLIRP